MIIYSRMWLVQKEKYLEEKRLLAQRSTELENARTKLVLSQIQPHFLYNTLSTITYLCTKNPGMAQKLCLDFTSYLRGNLSALGSDIPVAFEKELEHVKTYLKIECVRFADRHHSDSDCPEKLI